MSVDFINSVDFNKDSTTISFTADEEIFDTEESVILWCSRNRKDFAPQLYI